MCMKEYEQKLNTWYPLMYHVETNRPILLHEVDHNHIIPFRCIITMRKDTYVAILQRFGKDLHITRESDGSVIVLKDTYPTNSGCTSSDNKTLP